MRMSRRRSFFLSPPIMVIEPNGNSRFISDSVIPLRCCRTTTAGGRFGVPCNFEDSGFCMPNGSMSAIKWPRAWQTNFNEFLFIFLSIEQRLWGSATPRQWVLHKMQQKCGIRGSNSHQFALSAELRYLIRANRGVNVKFRAFVAMRPSLRRPKIPRRNKSSCLWFVLHPRSSVLGARDILWRFSRLGRRVRRH